MRIRKVEEKLTFQVAIDRGWQEVLTKLRAESKSTIRQLVEYALISVFGENGEFLPRDLDLNSKEKRKI